MKKLTAVVLLILSLLTSCAADTDADPFSVFTGEIEAEVVLQIDGNSSGLVYDGNSVEFTAPSELCGYGIKRSGDGITLYYRELEISVSENAGRIFRLCEAVFSPDKAVLVKAEQINGVTVTVVNTEQFSYAFSSDGMPLTVSGSFDGEVFVMTFSEFVRKDQ